MKTLSKPTVHALRALVYVASHPAQTGYWNIKDLADQLDIPFHFLTKTFQKLTAASILASYRGPRGGIKLNRDSKQILLSDIILVLEGTDFYDSCLLGLPGCGVAKPCPVHDFWKNVKETMKKEFQETSLAELGEKISDERLGCTL